MSKKIRIPKLLAHRDVIYEYIRTHDQAEFKQISDDTGIQTKECIAALRWMSQCGLISKKKRREGTSYHGMWSVVKDINAHKNDILRIEEDRNKEIQEEINLIKGIIESHDPIDRGKLDDLSGISKIKVTGILRYLKENGLAYRKGSREYWPGNPLGKHVTLWSLKPFELSPKFKPDNESTITKHDLEWHHYWSQPKHIRRTLPEPKIDE